GSVAVRSPSMCGPVTRWRARSKVNLRNFDASSASSGSRFRTTISSKESQSTMSKSLLTSGNAAWHALWTKMNSHRRQTMCDSKHRPARSVSNRTLGWGLLAVALVLPGCSSRARDDVRGGESHFLQSCTSECGDGLTCIDNRCTRECEERDDCRGLAKNAV